MVQRRCKKNRKNNLKWWSEVVNIEKEELEDRGGRHLVAYNDGWSVYLDIHSGNECFLWNSTSHQKIQLPVIKERFLSSFSKCVLSSAPTKSQCTVLFFYDNFASILYYKCKPHKRQQEKQWIKTNNNEGVPFFDVIAFNDKVYAIDVEGDIIQISLVGKSQSLDFNDCRFNTPFILPKKLQFVESRKELFVVRVLSKSNLEVLRIDFSCNKFVKIDTLGDQVFLLSNKYSGSVSGEEIGIMGGNRIYFTEDNNECLYAFHLDDDSLSVTAHRPNNGALWFSYDGLMPDLRITDNSADNEQETIQNEGEISDTEQICGVGDGTTVDIVENILLKLSIHLQESIASCVSKGQDYMNFRAVCRSWRALVPPCQWRCLSTECSTTTIPYPWLMHIQRENGVCNFHDPRDNVTYSVSNPVLSNCVIRFSKDGWLLVSRGPRTIFLYEPFTKARIELPNLPMDYCFNGVCFSALPTTSSFSIVGVSHVCSDWLRICYFSSDTKGWIRMDFDNGIPFIPSSSNLIFLNGLYYCLGQDGSLGTLELGEECTWEILSNPKPLSFLPTRCYNFLMSYEGRLYSVYAGNVTGESVKVFRLDRLGVDWTEVKSLGNEILFVSETSLVAMAREERMKSRVYFPSFSNINKSHVFYSLKTQKYLTFDEGHHSSQRLYDTREQLHSTWIQPRLVPRSW